MFQKVLIANRGVIARRIIRTLRKMAVSPAASESYLNQAAILEAARKTGAEAIHPGYGFLSENAAFAETCEAAGIVFLGPTPHQMRVLGLKHTARDIASREDIPLLPGTGLLLDFSHAFEEGERCGYPVILKSTAG